MMAMLSGLITPLLQWLFSGTVARQVAHTPDELARRGLDCKTLTGVEAPKL